jgi:hypothetical protein
MDGARRERQAPMLISAGTVIIAMNAQLLRQPEL